MAMKLPRYRVDTYSSTKTKEVRNFVVTATPFEQCDTSNIESKSLANFFVNDQTRVEEVKRLAVLTMEYMNRIQQATEEAYENNLMLDTLKDMK